MQKPLKLFTTPITKLFTSASSNADYSALVMTECTECFIRVVGWKEEDPRGNSLYITGFTGHNNPQQLSWSYRLTRIKRIIRGESDPDYELLTPEVVDNLIKALQECRETLWGKVNDNN